MTRFQRASRDVEHEAHREDEDYSNGDEYKDESELDQAENEKEYDSDLDDD